MLDLRTEDDMTLLQQMAALFAGGWTGDTIQAGHRLGVSKRAARDAILRLRIEGVAVPISGDVRRGAIYGKGEKTLSPKARTRKVSRMPKPRIVRPVSSVNVPIVKRALALRGELLDAWWPIGEAA